MGPKLQITNPNYLKFVGSKKSRHSNDRSYISGRHYHDGQSRNRQNVLDFRLRKRSISYPDNVNFDSADSNQILKCIYKNSDHSIINRGSKEPSLLIHFDKLITQETGADTKTSDFSSANELDCIQNVSTDSAQPFSDSRSGVRPNATYNGPLCLVDYM